ncbi:hypothetical protein SAMN05192560_2088 [Methylobacillus rhizosphaerae]|uniref:Uncharacterized protein n=2 Tax=Methylobacillus rhizosphaerae TaxID=551994 RepID=A0A239ARI9_9PROT|nr:hypothetical protein SAMN05192560_2088 [Methylobacillus rhizosphaerae]
MSIPVELENLADVMSRYRFAYLMTVSDQGSPHAVQVAASLQGNVLMVENTGKRTRHNALARPVVSLVWPPQSETDYSLIADGEAAVVDASLHITLTRAVLHRPRASSSPDKQPGSCGTDCVEISLA